ncbi:unnamed protein product [Cyclocybe aegerita]|uniref:Uncharacterized protein n=1 Tax=Cyclocybe aegerita TaxID=1973307 RepID=A0A8S0XSM8_CYCAE|nr:unnamed protein product [Cyclocybe aegerita]
MSSASSSEEIISPHPGLEVARQEVPSGVSSTKTLAKTPSSKSVHEPLKVIPVTPVVSTRYDLVERVDIPTNKLRIFPGGRHEGKGPNLSNSCVYDSKKRLTSWEKYIHPDGKPYFRDKERGLVTEVDVREEGRREELEQLFAQINVKWTQNPISKEDGHYEWYLGLPSHDTRTGSYYIVDHMTQDIFWLEDYEEEELRTYRILDESDPSVSNYDIFVSRNFYAHLENFPCHTELPPEASSFLHGTLTYTCTDHKTSRESATTPWNAADAKLFLELLESLDEKHEENLPGYDKSYRTWFIARLLSLILHSRSVHRHGMIDALTDRLMNVHYTSRTLIDYMVGCLSLFTHLAYVQRLENVWAAGIVSCSGWRSLVSALLIEWSDTNLLATVTLSANMAFLALNDLSDKARTGSILSTLFAVGSIVVGLHHIWRHRDKRESTAEQAGVYFRNASRRTGNLKLLAFYLCLPLILLLWSLLVFTCSIATYAFESPRPMSTHGVAGGILLLVVVAVGTTIRFFWGIYSPMTLS